METMRTLMGLMALTARWIGGRARRTAETGAGAGALRSSTTRLRSRAGAVVSGNDRAGVGAPDRPAVSCVAPAGAQRTTRQRDGDDGEAFARRYLEIAGLTFVAANVRYRDGEIDLVMRDARGRHPVLVFVEVRRRAGSSHGGAAGSVTSAKRRRVVAAASHFLVGLGLCALPACRFDVVTIDGGPGRGFIVEWIRDAFGDDG